MREPNVDDMGMSNESRVVRDKAALLVEKETHRETEYMACGKDRGSRSFVQ